eukprot:gene5941-4250_t
MMSVEGHEESARLPLPLASSLSFALKFLSFDPSFSSLSSLDDCSLSFVPLFFSKNLKGDQQDPVIFRSVFFVLFLLLLFVKTRKRKAYHRRPRDTLTSFISTH